jgi:hypothetical protein
MKYSRVKEARFVSGVNNKTAYYVQRSCDVKAAFVILNPEESLMSSVPIGRLVVTAGRPELEVTYATGQDFDDKPELAIGVLLYVIWQRCFDITRSAEGAEPPDELFMVLWEWVYCDQPLDKKAGLELALQQDNLWDFNAAMMRIRKKGRPVKSRHTAIKALFRKVYLKKTWPEVTQRLCQCGQFHDSKSPDNTLSYMRCQENIEAEVRHLKKMLMKWNIAFPPAPPTKHHPLTSQSEPQNQKKIMTLEESSGANRVAVTYAVQHPVIAKFLSGDSLPTIPINDEAQHGDESDAWNLFNPWVLGWVPMWFPEIRSEPIGTREELQRRRFDWFDREFKHFAGSDWPLKGSLESQREIIGNVLLRMYRAARDEEIPEMDIL